MLQDPPMPFYTAAGYKKLVLTSEPAGRSLPRKHWPALLKSLGEKTGLNANTIFQALSVVEEVATHSKNLYLGRRLFVNNANTAQDYNRSITFHQKAEVSNQAGEKK